MRTTLSSVEVHVGRLAIAKDAQGNTVAVGRIISGCDAPTVTIENAAGLRVHWRADLCELSDLNDQETAELFRRH